MNEISSRKVLIYSLLTIVIFLSLIMIIKVIYHLFPNVTMLGENKENLEFCGFWIDIFATAASLGMIIITAKSINRNANENIKNRELQIKTLKYQTKITWVNQLKEEVNSLCAALSDNIHSSFIIYKNENQSNNFCTIIDNSLSKANLCKFKLETLLIGNENDKEKNFLEVVNMFYNRFAYLLLDIQFLLSINSNFKNKEVIDKVEDYKKSQHKIESGIDEFRRIWEIITIYEINEGLTVTSALNELMARYGFATFKNECAKFIKYENEEAEAILKL